MIFSIESYCTLVVLLELAPYYPANGITTDEIAVCNRVSPDHLDVAVTTLTQNGYLDSKKQRNGKQ